MRKYLTLAVVAVLGYFSQDVAATQNNMRTWSRCSVTPGFKKLCAEAYGNQQPQPQKHLCQSQTGEKLAATNQCPIGGCCGGCCCSARSDEALNEAEEDLKGIAKHFQSLIHLNDDVVPGDE